MNFEALSRLGFGILVSAFLATHMNAYADNAPTGRASLVFKSAKVAVILKNRAEALSGSEAAEAEQRLDELLALVGGGPVAPSIPACNILGYGVASGAYYNYRIAASGGVPLAGTNTVPDLLTKLGSLESARICAVPTQACAIEGYGVAGGAYYNLRISIPGLELAGANSLDQLISSFNLLREGRLCQFAPPTVRCEIKGYGVANGAYYNNTISLGGLALAGANSMDEIIAILGKLHAAAICQ